MTRDAIQPLETAAAEMQQSRRPWVFVNPPDDVIHRSTEEVDAAVAQFIPWARSRGFHVVRDGYGSALIDGVENIAPHLYLVRDGDVALPAPWRRG